MSLRSNGATTRDTSSVLKIFALEVALACLGCCTPQLAAAQDVPAFAPGMINHMQQMKRFKDVDRGQQPTPPVIPRFSVDPDPTGAVGTFQPNGATFTVNNAFFQNLGNQWQNLLQLPPAARWLDCQRSRRCHPLCDKPRYRPDLPVGRRRHVSER